MTGEGLGADGVPDLLILSVSITDYIGHGYGPDSPEVLDIAHRVDARLATFLDFLDTKVGRGRWVASLTADHGIAPSPAAAREFEASPRDSVGGFPAPWRARGSIACCPADCARPATSAARGPRARTRRGLGEVRGLRRW